VADTAASNDAYRNLGGKPIQFQVRHVLYFVAAVCLVLGIPGLTYIAGWILFPWLMFLLVVGPIVLGQLLFILLIPPLRHHLLGLKSAARLSHQ
jgi:hypothetical protein